MGNEITAAELNNFKSDTSGYISYLLRVDAFKTMADMARDLGVEQGRIRQIKNRGKNENT